MRKSSAIAALLAASLAHSGGAAGPSVLELALRDEGRPTITRAIDVVNESSPREVNAGDDVVFSARVGTEALLRQGFQVRIFTLPSQLADPVEAALPIDDCLVYFSAVYPVASTTGAKISLISNASEGWLSAMPNKTVGNGYYLLVFEHTGVRETVFRIKRDDAKAYFSTGLRLVVRATSKSSFENVVAKLEVREAQRAADKGKLAVADSSLPCYRYEKVTRFAGLADAPQQLAMATCEPAGSRRHP